MFKFFFHDVKFLKAAFKDWTIIMVRSHITISLRISTSVNQIKRPLKESYLSKDLRSHKESILPHFAW